MSGPTADGVQHWVERCQRGADPTALAGAPCPDCTATMLDHDDTCTANAMGEEDRVWFDAHPVATDYWRDATPHELAVQRVTWAVPDSLEVTCRVHVEQLQPGVRLRRFHPVVLMPPSS